MDTKLEVVRKLLAKAEGTSNEHEAQAYLAKAQALMTQYSFDEAMVRQSTPKDERVQQIGRTRIDLPGRQVLVKAKRALLGVIAQNNNCETLIYADKHLEIVGYPGDRERVELLFDSLLLQLEKAVRLQGRRDVVYRNNFVWGYVNRINQRLEEIHDSRPSSGALVLRDAAAEVKASLGKVRKAPQGKRRQYDAGARSDGSSAGNQAVLDNRLGSAARGAIH